MAAEVQGPETAGCARTTQDSVGEAEQPGDPAHSPCLNQSQHALPGSRTRPQPLPDPGRVPTAALALRHGETWAGYFSTPELGLPIYNTGVIRGDGCGDA